MPTKKRKWSDIQIVAKPKTWSVERGDGQAAYIAVYARKKPKKDKVEQHIGCIAMANEALDWLADQLIHEGFPVDQYAVRILCPSLKACKILRRQEVEFLCAKQLKTFTRLSGEFKVVNVQAITPTMTK